jgi:hypothetical protein
MSKESVRQIKYILKHYHGMGSHFSRADLDAIMMLIEVSRAEIPKRFIDLAIDLDNNFEIKVGDSRSVFIDRSLRIFEVFEKFPTISSDLEESEITPTFVISTEDKKRVLELSAEMRKIISFSEVFDAAHKRRLLDRISAIEKQVHQKRGTFDTILGGVSDIGETFGKFGKDIKPLTDRMAEVLSITRKGTKLYDQLPAPDEVKRLPAPTIDDLSI